MRTSKGSTPSAWLICVIEQALQVPHNPDGAEPAILRAEGTPAPLPFARDAASRSTLESHLPLQRHTKAVAVTIPARDAARTMNATTDAAVPVGESVAGSRQSFRREIALYQVSPGSPSYADVPRL